jgi:outer membrane protein assembly factor BamB
MTATSRARVVRSVALAALGALLATSAHADEVDPAALAGTWQGDAVHRGQRTPVWLEVASEGGSLGAKLTLPAAGVYRRALPAPAWSTRLDGPVWAGLRYDAASGLVLVGTDAGSLYALRAATGQQVWRARAGGPIRARPTVAAGGVYALSDDGYLYRFDLRSGRRAWKARVDRGDYVRLPGTDPKSRWDRYGSTPLVEGGRAFVGSRDGALVALDAATGRRRWAAPAGDRVTGGPARLGDAVFFASYDGKVRAVSAADGTPRWEWDAQGAIPNDVVAADGRVLVGSRTYDLTALDAATGRPLWQYYYWFSWVESPPAVRDGVAYVGSSDALRVFALDVRGGALRWERSVPGWSWSQPAVLGDAVFVGAVGDAGYPVPRAGALLALDRATGEVRWARSATPAERGEWGFAAGPAAAGDVVVAADLAGVVSAFPPRGAARNG